ncbi:MAG: chromate transporter [Rikenellaceae bacterium]
MIYLELFLSYLKIGFFSFGGGYGMLSLLYNEVVVRNEWISSAELADIIAISQMTPGPIAINSATYIGYTVGGFWGSMVSSLAVCTPALTAMVIITRSYIKLRDNLYIKKIMSLLKPVILAMIASAGAMLLFPEDPTQSSFIDWWSYLLFSLAFIASLMKVNAILIISLSALAGIVIYAN